MKPTALNLLLVLVAGAILCLHSLVPHFHGSQAAGGEANATVLHVPENGLFSLLRDFFTDSDLGEDHLEHFAVDHDLTLDAGITALLPPRTVPRIVLVNSKVLTQAHQPRLFRSRFFPPSAVYPDDDAPRGPPTTA